MNRSPICFMLLSLIAWLSLSQAVAQPSAVVQGLQNRWPHAQNVHFDRESRNCWEAEFKLEGKPLETLWLADGTLIAVNRKVERNQVPVAVQQALGRHWMRVYEVEVLELTNGQRLYEVDLPHNRKRWYTDTGIRHSNPCLPRPRRDSF